jgi:hypothetical protein
MGCPDLRSVAGALTIQDVQSSAGEIVFKTTVTHTVTYFVVGAAVFFLFDYPTLIAESVLQLSMRPLNSPLVIAGPLLQPLRGVLFGVVFYLLREPFFGNRRGWLVMWTVLVSIGIVGNVWGTSGFARRSHLYGVAGFASPEAVTGNPSSVPASILARLPLGESPSAGMVDMDHGDIVRTGVAARCIGLDRNVTRVTVNPVTQARQRAARSGCNSLEFYVTTFLIPPYRYQT